MPRSCICRNNPQRCQTCKPIDTPGNQPKDRGGLGCHSAVLARADEVIEENNSLLRCTSPTLAYMGVSLNPTPGGVRGDFGQKPCLLTPGLENSPCPGQTITNRVDARGCSGRRQTMSCCSPFRVQPACNGERCGDFVELGLRDHITDPGEAIGRSVFHQLHRRLRAKLPVA